MLLLSGQEESSSLDAILVTAIAGAQTLGLHRLKDAKLLPSISPTAALSTIPESSCVRTEVAVRIW